MEPDTPPEMMCCGFCGGIHETALTFGGIPIFVCRSPMVEHFGGYVLIPARRRAT